MQSATERRQLVLEFISDQRKVSMEDIMHEFDISRSTAKRDVQLLYGKVHRIRVRQHTNLLLAALLRVRCLRT